MIAWRNVHPGPAILKLGNEATQDFYRSTRKLVDEPQESWKLIIKALKAVIQYVRNTKKFQPKAQMEQEAREADDIGEKEGIGR